MKAFLIILKVILAVPLFCLFILIRLLQYFLKICGTVVSFVCVVASVVVVLGVLVELVLEMEGR